MTRLQLILVGALSTFMTILVLVGSDGKSGLSEAAERALQDDPAAAAAVVAGTTVADTTDASTTSSAEDSSTDASSSNEEVETPTLDATAGEDATGETAGADDTETEPESDESPPAATTPSDVPPATNIKHVFVITLQGQGFDAAFGAASAAPYLAGELRGKGTLLTNFASLGRSDVADRIAFAGGQPPNASSKSGCPIYQEVGPLENPDKNGVIAKDGCIYPNTVLSLGDQLTSNKLTWQSYAEDHEKGPGGANQLCRRPVSGEADDTQAPRPGDAYAAKNNPWVYFHSLLDLSGCDADVGPLGKLSEDLADAKKTPNLAYIAPSLCHDGSAQATGCDGPTGLAGADEFLKAWVPRILDNAAFKEAGLLVITFAGGPGTADAPSKNGTLLISRFAQAGGSDDTAYDPYSLLRSTEDLLGIKALAKPKDAKSFAGTVLASSKVLTEGDG